jgi:Domain of unknown function (DUF4032)
MHLAAGATPERGDAASGAEPAVTERMPADDWARLAGLPWHAPLETWPEHGVVPLTLRRGESRHPVLFVEREGQRYAIKETSPGAAEREIAALDQLRTRPVRTIAPVGWVVVPDAPIVVDEIAGHPVYISGDRGYCVTRLAERVLPNSILYRYPFTDENKRLLWNAVVELLLGLHETGVYWGDPSLANVLIAFGDRRLAAVMADAETAEIVPGRLAEGLRRQDLDALLESLEWQAEDIRLARDLPDDQQLVTAGDAAYIRAQYTALRSAHEAEAERAHTLYGRVRLVRQRIQRLAELGYSVLGQVPLTAHPLGEVEAQIEAEDGAPIGWPATPGQGMDVATVRRGWYAQRIFELLGVRVPDRYAARIYEHINVHKWLLSEHAGTDVGMEAAVRDWRERVHTPLMVFLASYAPEADRNTRFAMYVAILDHTWRMSERQLRPVTLEEGAMDYALARSRRELTRMGTPPLTAEDY